MILHKFKIISSQCKLFFLGHITFRKRKVVQLKLHVINKSGVQVDIPLYTTKTEALSLDQGDGTALSVFYGGQNLYAPTTNRPSYPDEAVLALVDGQGQTRYVHRSIGTKTAVLYHFPKTEGRLAQIFGRKNNIYTIQEFLNCVNFFDNRRGNKKAPDLRGGHIRFLCNFRANNQEFDN